MSVRPVYIGVGECTCGRVDVQLYHVPNTKIRANAVCALCLEARGFVVPVPRTAEDIEMRDGQLSWRPSSSALVHAGKLDLGHGHFFEVVLGSDDQLVGWLHTHPDARSSEGMLCQSFCAVRPLNGSPVYQIVNVEPLTLTPSLKCGACGVRGDVTNGRWEPYTC